MGQGVGAGAGAVGDGDRHAGVLQRGDHGAGGAAAPQHQRGAGGGVHAVRAEVGDEAEAVGVAAGDPAVLEDQRVHGAGAAGGGFDGAQISNAATLLSAFRAGNRARAIDQIVEVLLRVRERRAISGYALTPNE